MRALLPCCVALVLVACVPVAKVPASSAPEGVLRLSLVAERLVVPVELRSASASQSVSLIVELDAPFALSLREDILSGLKLQAAEPFVTLSAAGGFRSGIARERIASYEGALDLAQLSAVHSTALEDRPLAGVLGGGFLKSYRVVVDVQGRALKLLPRKYLVEADAEIRVPARFADGAHGVLQIGSSRYETSASRRDALGASIEIQAAAQGSSLDLARYLVLPPGEQGEARLVRGGVDLFEHFRVELDWAHDEARFTETLAPRELGPDRAYFHAQALGTADAFARFLRAHPQSRFRAEASRLRLDALLVNNADDASIAAAARAWFETVPESVRGDTSYKLLVKLSETHRERVQMILAVGDAASGALPADARSKDRHRIHRLLGSLRLAQGDVDGAWRDLLIAVIGLPEDARLNFDLARIYEQQGRAGRAYSRYRLTASLLEKHPDALSESEQLELRAALARLAAPGEAERSDFGRPG